MSDQETPQQPSSEERSSSANQPERDRRNSSSSSGGTGGSGSSGGGGGERSRHRRRRPHNPQPRAEASLNMEELRELMELFTEHGLTEFEFERDEFRIHLGRNLASQSSASAHETTHAAPAHDASHARAAAAGASTLGSHAATPPHPGAQAEAAASADEDLHIITSPIVGTFYRSPSPTAEQFVRIGSRVEHDTVVCIIEAMKLMNEIQAETSGEVVKIYVENGQPVEYGQPLFGIKK